MAAIKLKNVYQSFGKTEVLHDINIEIGHGEFVALVGPSGCGKSTLLRLISGLEAVTAGDIIFDDDIVNDSSPAQREIAMVFQSYALYPHMTVYKNLAFGLENLRMDRSEIKQRIAGVAKMLDLQPYLNRKPKALSGGQQQRVAIGRAIVRKPRVFLFDEPLSNLDAKLRVQTRSELTRLHKQLQTTMIYVTHDQVEAMTMAQKIVVLNQGRVEQVGKPLAIFEYPANKFVAEFIGSPKMNILPGKVVALNQQGVTLAVAALGTICLSLRADHLACGDAVAIGIRPSHIKVTDDESGIAFELANIESMGHETFIYGVIDGVVDEIVVHIPNNFISEPGAILNLEFPPDFLHVFDEQTGKALPREAP